LSTCSVWSLAPDLETLEMGLTVVAMNASRTFTLTDCLTRLAPERFDASHRSWPQSTPRLLDAGL